MDPNFLPLLVQQLAERNQMISIGKRQAIEEREREMLETSRKNLLRFAASESDVLLRDSTSVPQQVLVRSQILMNQLNGMNIIPSEYEDATEKENIILLWRKLENISEKCKAQLTPVELEQCEKCLNAVWMQSFIQAIVQNHPAYVNYLAAKAELDQKTVRLRNLERSLYIVLLLIVAVICLFYFTKTLVDTTADLIGLLFLFAGMPAIFIRSLFRPQYDQIENSFMDFKPGGEQGKFWLMVIEKFGSMPTQEDLDEKWKEQEDIIKSIFGEPSQNETQQ